MGTSFNGKILATALYCRTVPDAGLGVQGAGVQALSEQLGVVPENHTSVGKSKISQFKKHDTCLPNWLVEA